MKTDLSLLVINNFWIIRYAFCVYQAWFWPNWPLGRFGLVVEMSVFCILYVPFPCNFSKASHWPSDHMIRFWPLIGPSELCIHDKNSEEVHNLQSHDGLIDENAKEVHNLHHNL